MKHTMEHRTLSQALDQRPQKELPKSVVPFASVNTILKKSIRFELYTNVQIFRGIFHENGLVKWIEFQTKCNGSLLNFFNTLSLPDREKLIRFLQEF